MGEEGGRDGDGPGKPIGNARHRQKRKRGSRKKMKRPRELEKIIQLSLQGPHLAGAPRRTLHRAERSSNKSILSVDGSCLSFIRLGLVTITRSDGYGPSRGCCFNGGLASAGRKRARQVSIETSGREREGEARSDEGRGALEPFDKLRAKQTDSLCRRLRRDRPYSTEKQRGKDEAPSGYGE